LDVEPDEFGHPYLGLTKKERGEMLGFLGIRSADELFVDVPIKNGVKGLPSPASEALLFQELYALNKQNKNCLDHPCFLGGGSHLHYVPAVVQRICERGEFLTSYTPYQPEISQGMLQAMFEYQSMISELTGLDVVNASHYTYGTSLGEAAHMANRVTGRKKIVVCGAVNPERLGVLRAYAYGRDLSVVQTAFDSHSGELDPEAACNQIDSETALVYSESPNYFGVVEGSLKDLASRAHSKGALFCQGFDLISLAILKSPAEVDADMAVGDGVGSPMSLGGPGLGLFAADKKFVRSVPGRLVGATSDRSGKRGYVITLQTREQHIRREKATSNITTNSSIIALANAVYLALLGPDGLKRLAEAILSNTVYTQRELGRLRGVVSPLFSGFSYQDFVFGFEGDSDRLEQRLMDSDVLGPSRIGSGYGLGGGLWLVGVSELTTKQHVESLANIIGGVSNEV
jgi:glycine dehydrogenase subunit 1